MALANIEITKNGSVYIDESFLHSDDCEEVCAPTCVRFGFSSGECVQIGRRVETYKCRCVRPLTFNVCNYVQGRQLGKCQHGRP